MAGSSVPGPAQGFGSRAEGNSSGLWATKSSHCGRDWIGVVFSLFLSGKHFIDEYQEQLLHRVSSVDDVLHLLSRQGLDPAQLQSIQAERNNQERLRKLFKLVPTWDTEQQHRLYSIFWDTNPFLMEDLQGKIHQPLCLLESAL